MEIKEFLKVVPFSGKRVTFFEGEKRYLSTGDLLDDSVKFVKVTYKDRPSRADIEVTEGDILFARMKQTNKVLYIDSSLSGIIVSTGFSVHRAGKDVDSEYLIQILKHNIFNRQKNKYCTGAIQPAITNSGIQKIKIPIPYKDGKPDLLTQKRIAKVLSNAEKLIAKRKESITLLDEFLKATFLEMFGDPVRNEKGWNVDLIKNHIGKVITGNTPPRRNINNYGNYIEWIKTDNIETEKKYVTQAKECLSEIGKEKGRVVSNGALLVTCIAGSLKSIGNCALTNREIAFNQQINAIVPFEDVTPEFLYWLFKISKFYIQSYATKGMKKIITKSEFEKIKIIKPEYDLQKQFAKISKKTEAIKKQFEKSLQELENLYGSLSKKAFKGELDLSKVKIEETVTEEPKYIAPN